MKRFAGIREGTFRDFLKSTPDSKIVGAFNRLGLIVMSRHPTRNGALTIGETFSFRDPDCMWGGTLWTFKDGSRYEVYLHTGKSLGIYTTKSVEEMLSLLNYFAKFVMPKVALHRDKERAKQAKNLMHHFNPQQESAARDFFKKLGRQLRWEEYMRDSQYIGYDDTFNSPGGVPKALEIAKWRIESQNRDYWVIDTYYDPQPPIHRIRFATAEEAMKAANEWWFKEGRNLMLKGRAWRHMAEAFEPGDARKFLAGLKHAPRIPDAQVINNGRKFRTLVSKHLADRVEVWKDPEDRRGWGGVLIVVLLVSHGLGAYVKYPIRENWGSYDLLRDRLRGWRNLQGAKLFVQGVPSGVVSYFNPALA